MESRRPDVVLLVGACVVVIELKGESQATQADVDQVAAYERDVRNYHAECDSPERFEESVDPPRFPLRVAHLRGSEEVDWIDFRKLRKRHLQHLLTDYRIPVVEVDGEIGDIIDVFVRINSTGKALTNQEKRHARYLRQQTPQGSGPACPALHELLSKQRHSERGPSYEDETC